MTKRGQIYKCEKCGNIIEVSNNTNGGLKCCREDMQLLEENSVDAAKEKHVPVIEKIDGGFTVKVGDVDHPMQEDHFIEWIELTTGNEVYRKYLKAGEAPTATFRTDATDAYARAYCNLHGLWKS